MPQIWLSYDELADLMGCDAEAARTAAASIPLDRRKSHDGRTRAKLNPDLADLFLDRVLRHRLDQELRACAGDLRAVHQRMARAPLDASRRRIAG